MTGPIPGKQATTTTQNSFSRQPSAVKKCTVVGCPKEIKPQEARVGITPSCAAEYILNGHSVIIQTGAGVESGFHDEKYITVGCQMVPTAEAVYEAAEMIIKVKEPQKLEYSLIRPGQVVFTYFHFAASKELTDAMIKQKAICIAYETVTAADRSLPLLTPMSEIAGRMSIQQGAKFLEKPMGGLGVLLSGVPGVPPARIVILGGGVVGFNAAKIAAGTGADVVILDINVGRLRYLDDVLPRNCRTLYCNSDNVSLELSRADLVIGCVLVPGAKAPKLVKRSHLKLMKPGSLVVDVAIDQGGCFESSKMTHHDSPTYFEEGIMHYCVGNMPGAVPQTSTIALTNVTLRYGLEMANKGWLDACKSNNELRAGLNIAHGKVLCQALADTFALTSTDVTTYIKEATDETGAEKIHLNTLAEGIRRIEIAA